MKAKITKPDGTVVELDGTPDEIRAYTDGVQLSPVPNLWPFGVIPYQPYTPVPWDNNPTITWGCDSITDIAFTNMVFCDAGSGITSTSHW